MLLACMHAARRSTAILLTVAVAWVLANAPARAGDAADLESRLAARAHAAQPRAQPTVAVAAGGLVEVVEYYNAGLEHYFITAEPAEIAALDGGAFGGAWVRTGSTFPAWESGSVAGIGITVPVCRFFGTDQYRSDGSRIGPNSHFYTADPAECEHVKTAWQSIAGNGISYPAWTYEGVAFAVVLPVAGACPAGTQGVYRAYNNGARGDPNHRYSLSVGALQGMAGWAFEGLVMCVPAGAAGVLPATLAGCDTACPAGTRLGGGTGLVDVAVVIANPGSTPLDLTIVPGQIFVAGSTSLQDGMSLERLHATIPPGTTRTFVLALFCINEHRAPSSDGSVYAPGGVTANAALLELATMVDGRLGSSVDPLGMRSIAVQYSLWEITDGPGSLTATQKGLLTTVLTTDTMDPAFAEALGKLMESVGP